jgi:hypothetical protein
MTAWGDIETGRRSSAIRTDGFAAIAIMTR